MKKKENLVTLKVVDFKKTNANQELIETLEKIIADIKKDPESIASFIMITATADTIIRISPSENLNLVSILGQLEIAKYAVVNQDEPEDYE